MPMKSLHRLVEGLSDLDQDDLLEKVGLERRRGPTDYLLPALGLLGAGLAVGCGLGMLLAPKSGRELRAELGRRLASGRSRAPAPADGPGPLRS